MVKGEEMSDEPLVLGNFSAYIQKDLMTVIYKSAYKVSGLMWILIYEVKGKNFSAPAPCDHEPTIEEAKTFFVNALNNGWLANVGEWSVK